METRVYYLYIDLPLFETKDYRKITDNEFVELAEQYGNVYSLSGFQDALNNEEFNPVNYWVRFIEVNTH